MVLTFESVNEILQWNIQTKAIKEYFSVSYAFESVGEILRYDHSSESSFNLQYFSYQIKFEIFCLILILSEIVVLDYHLV